MQPVLPGRHFAHLEGDFAVFLIGVRINRFLDVRGWWPVVQAMPPMIRELEADPGLGLLHSWGAMRSLRSAVLVQYWRSFEHLHAYARAADSEHLPAWAHYNKTIRRNESVGIWHETFLVRAGEHESVYGNMPPMGLGLAGTLQPATGRSMSALGRLHRSEGLDAPVTMDGDSAVVDGSSRGNSIQG